MVSEVIELFVKGQTVDLATTDVETLGHSCVGPGAQMRAASASRGLRIYSEGDRDALERVPTLAEALGERLVIWDVGTLRGRLVARRRGVRMTPAVVYGSNEGAISPASFEEKASALLRARKPAVG